VRLKTAPARVKTVAQTAELGEGEFEAIVSVFNTVDSVGDVVMPGAFAKTLAAYAEKDAPVPVVWSHDWSDPFSHIGASITAEEVDAGLKVRGKLDIENNPKAAQVYRLLKGGRIRDFSFAYEIKEGGFREAKDGEEPGMDQPYELRELELFEVGPCLVGAHRDTELLAIKNAPNASAKKADDPANTTETKAEEEADVSDSPDVDAIVQRAVSKFAEDLLAALRAQNSNISKDEDGKAMPVQPAITEEPPGAKVNEPARPGAASDRLRTDLRLLIAEADFLAD
jgi:HK97 family phage prohead protease